MSFRRYWNKCIRTKLLAWTAAGVVGTAIMFCIGRKAYFHFRWRALKAELRADGYPLTAEELRARYPKTHLPPRKKGDALDRATGLIAGPLKDSAAYAIRLSSGDYYSYNDGAPVPPEARKLLRRHAADNAAYYKALDKALQETPKRLGINLDDPTGRFGLPYLAQYRRHAKQQAIRAHEAAMRDDGDECVQAIENLYRLSRDLKQEPFLITSLVRLALDGIMAKNTVEPALNRTRMTDGQLRRLDEALRKTGEILVYPEALLGEMVYMNRVTPDEVIDEFLAVELFKSRRERERFFEAMLYKYAGGFEADRYYYGEAISRVYDDYRLPLRARAMQRFEYCEEERFEDCYWIYPVLYSEMLSIFKRLNRQIISAHCRLCLARLAVAVERYRLAHGRPPVALDELAPEYLDAAFLDPYSGELFKYRPAGDAYRVYSVGVNYVDDGGDEEDAEFEDSYWEKDIVFTVKRAPEPAESAGEGE